MSVNSRKRVVVAMSGGVDSSAAAALLLKEGYDLIGVSLKLWPKSLCGQKAPRSCCSLQDIEDARSVAHKLNIPFYVFNVEKEFEKEVIDYFCHDYAQGRTPNPCIICNEKIKFGILLKKALALGATYVATGHYARLAKDKKSRRLVIKEAKDKSKDQSYALFSLSQNQLKHALFPVGNYLKKNIRRFALNLGLKTHEKPDSQEICFVLSNDYHKFLKEKLKTIKPGYLIDKNGKILGNHQGICFYTIGQRKGLGAFGKPMYVININSQNNTIIVGEVKDLKRKEFFVHSLNWLTQPKAKMEIKAKIRYNHPKAAATVRLMNNGRAKVIFSTPQKAITPGQAAVFYKNDTVIGGGWIE